MVDMLNFLSTKKLLMKLYQDEVIVYPTESVFGLGCNPDSESAIYTLLKMKRRSWKKGLILIAANYAQLLRYIDDTDLNYKQKERVFSTWPGPNTWIFPARLGTPYWLTGRFSSIAVRVSCFDPIQHLCLSFGKPLVSTSANLSGCAPARTIAEVYNQFGHYNIALMNESVLGLSNPSKIRDAITGEVIRS